MRTCHENQMLLEKMRLALVDEATQREVADHLTTCAECRRYQEFLVRSEGVIQSMEMPVPEGPDGRRRVAMLQQTIRRSHLVLLVSGVVLLLLVAGSYLALGPVATGVLALAAMGLWSVLAVRNRWVYGRMVADIQEGGDLVGHLRAVTAASIARIRFLAPVAVLGGLALASSVVLGGMATDRPVLFSIRVLEVGSFLGAAAIGVRSYVVDLPRLRRELEELE